ncbi:MAG: hypothetical protein ACK5Q5_05165, partial [Planctomycetaceae bacterium]
RLRLFIPLFLRERFLFDYTEDRPLLGRLNGVLRRVRLSPLPEPVLEVLSAARQLVKSRVRDLLPVSCYPAELTELELSS